MTSDYRKIIEDADAAKKEASRQQQEAEQRRQAAVGQASHKAKTWYEGVFLKEIAAANEQISGSNAKFVVENIRALPGGLSASFRFIRYQRSSDQYILSVNGERFSLAQYREGIPRPGLRNPQKPEPTKMNLPEMQPFTNLHLGGDDPMVPEMLGKIIDLNVNAH